MDVLKAGEKRQMMWKGETPLGKFAPQQNPTSTGGRNLLLSDVIGREGRPTRSGTTKRPSQFPPRACISVMLGRIPGTRTIPVSDSPCCQASVHLSCRCHYHQNEEALVPRKHHPCRTTIANDTSSNAKTKKEKSTRAIRHECTRQKGYA